MAMERAVGGSSLVEVLDRVLDKGIVVDAWVRLSLVGIELVTIEARVVVASVDTYLRYAEAISGTRTVARPAAIEGPAGRYEELEAEIAGLRAQLAAPAVEAQPLLRPKAARSRRTAVLA